MNQQDTIVEDFLKEFPELRNHPSIQGDDYSDTPYIFFGVMREVLLESLEASAGLAQRIVIWLDGTLNNSATDDYVKDMLWIEFFEGSEIDEVLQSFLLTNLRNEANLMYRQYLYIMENGGLTDAKTGEILKYIEGKPAIKTGKHVSDIK